MAVLQPRKVVSQGYSYAFDSRSLVNSRRYLELEILSNGQNKKINLEPEPNDWATPIKILNFVNALRKESGNVEISIFKELIKTYRHGLGMHELIEKQPFDGKYRNLQISEDELSKLYKIKLHGTPIYTEKQNIANMIFKSFTSEFIIDLQKVRYYTISISGKI